MMGIRINGGTYRQAKKMLKTFNKKNKYYTKN